MDNHSKNSSIYLEISLLALLIEGNEKTDTNIMSQTGLSICPVLLCHISGYSTGCQIQSVHSSLHKLEKQKQNLAI